MKCCLSSVHKSSNETAFMKTAKKKGPQKGNPSIMETDYRHLLMVRIPLITIINTLHVFITLFSYVLEVFHMMLYYFSINGNGIQSFGNKHLYFLLETLQTMYALCEY